MWTNKLKAAGFHFVICCVIALFVLVIVYAGWYQSVLSHTQQIGSILIVLLAVDVVLGPLLTFLVFKKGKKTLKFDLTVIAALQLGFLVYGMHTIYIARPSFIVFAKDRFEAVSTIEWPDDEKDAKNLKVEASLFGPVWVGAKSPIGVKDREKIMFESTSGGADITQRPRLYVPYEQVKTDVQAKAKDMSELRKLNASNTAEIDSAIAKSGLSESALGFLPMKGKIEDAAVLIDRQSGMPLAMLKLKPWL